MLSGLRLVKYAAIAPFSTGFIHEIEASSDFHKLVTQYATQPHAILFYSNYGKQSVNLKKKIESKAKNLQKTVITVDVEAAPEVCEEFHVESVPTLFTMKGTNIKETFVGVPNDDKINELVKTL
jgi:thioredoxin-like negative regulator of GroEL